MKNNNLAKNNLHGSKAELEPQFIFTSRGRSLIASGVTCTISNKGLDQDRFIETIKSKLNELKAAGQENPVVIGSIPFDTEADTELFIPKNSHFSSAPLPKTASNNDINQLVSLSQVTGEEHFKGAVDKALLLSEHTDLDKVVLSRAIDVQTSTKLNANDMASVLYQQNPSAYIFSIPQSDGSVLVGASPELLVRKENDQVSSNPLAGSRKRTDSSVSNQEISEELWKCEKDRYEHKLVADAVYKHLKPFCQTLSKPETPSIIETSAMLHLSTKVDGTLSSEDTSVLELAYALHPTPAICGIPPELAKATIQSLEGYERAQFCGAVGWMDAQGNGEWVVTIRCGVIKQNSIRLYAGAGIVKGSDPSAEFNETEAKLNTMLTALGLNLADAILQTTQVNSTI